MRSIFGNRIGFSLYVKQEMHIPYKYTMNMEQDILVYLYVLIEESLRSFVQ